MATQQQLVTDLAAVTAQLKKSQGEIAGVQTETNTLKDKVAALEKIIEDGPPVSAELEAAVAEVKVQSQAVDDAIPEAVTTA